MKRQCKDRKESLFWWERVGGCCFQGAGVAWTTGSYRDPRKVDYAKLQNGTSEGGTRIWTRDLLICSQMLYPWAIPPDVIWQTQLTPLCCCSYIWTLPNSAAPPWAPTPIVIPDWPSCSEIQPIFLFRLVGRLIRSQSSAHTRKWRGWGPLTRKCRGWGTLGLAGENAGGSELSYTAKLGSEPGPPCSSCSICPLPFGLVLRLLFFAAYLSSSHHPPSPSGLCSPNRQTSASPPSSSPIKQCPSFKLISWVRKTRPDEYKADHLFPKTK